MVVTRMASVRKHPKSKFWSACFRDSNGVRTTRSTKTADKRLALKTAMEWEGAASRAGSGRLIEAQARAVVNSILEHAGHEAITFYKTRDWLNEWLNDKSDSREESTTAKYKQVVDRFLNHLGQRADHGLAHVTPSDIRSFRDLLHAEGRAASTVNQIIAKVLSASFAKARRLGYIPINPCSAVEPLKKTRSVAGVFSSDQVKQLLEAAPSEDWRGFILSGFFTGQRLRDLADLRWSSVDFEKKMIFIDEQDKGGAGVAIPIHQDLLDQLLKLRVTGDPNGPVFPSLFGKAGGGKSGLSEAFKRIMSRAGIAIEKRLESGGGVGRGRNKLSFHSLRHSFNSELANAGVAQEIRQKLTGHRGVESNKLYTHLDFPALEAAVRMVPSIHDSGNRKGP
jgi:integrase